MARELACSTQARAAVSIMTTAAPSTSLVVAAALLGGVPDPTFTLNVSTSLAAHKALTKARRCPGSSPGKRVLGFSGWRFSHSGEVVLGYKPLDDLIFGLPEFRALPDSVREHITQITQEATRISNMDCGDGHTWTAVKNSASNTVDDAATVENGAPPASNTIEEDCCKSDAPIRGPDDPTRVHYDPAHDDEGCFVKMQFHNNCYNYGTDVLTNTFAQPGRGSGVCSHKERPCVANTCADVRRAAESDGLVWAGTDLPKKLPDVGHFVSLHIWPQTNFHWIRMDANLTWSHKPGGSPVRDHDNDGKVIRDPGQANFAPWTHHCGYMLARPSNATLY